jgi:cytochrome c oxidase assembly protein subunit 15
MTVSLPLQSRWLHRWAVWTACATFALLGLGTVVTTFQVGMADPIWPTYPWHLLLISWQEPRPGFLVEHAHRAAGYFVGCCVIVLNLMLGRVEPRLWVRWLGAATLLGVVLQGLLGGFRVRLHEWVGADLALIHGCFAQIVFAMTVGLAVVTSPRWLAETSASSDSAPDDRSPESPTASARAAALTVAGLLYLQIIFGAILRHTYSAWGQRGHLLVAFVVVTAVAWLVRETLADTPTARGAWLLAALVSVQLLLGVEAWMVKYLAVASPPQQAAIRTLHVLVGFLVFAAAVRVCLLAHRRSEARPLTSGCTSATTVSLEGVS